MAAVQGLTEREAERTLGKERRQQTEILRQLEREKLSQKILPFPPQVSSAHQTTWLTRSTAQQRTQVGDEGVNEDEGEVGEKEEVEGQVLNLNLNLKWKMKSCFSKILLVLK